MDTQDIVFFACRMGYEIKTWLYEVPRDATEEQIIKLGKEEFKRVGVQLLENESFDWEAF